MSGPKRERDDIVTSEIFVGSMFGLFSKAGMVKVELLETRGKERKRLHVLLEPAEARRQAMFILEAAGAAERDAAFWNVARSMGMSEDDAARFLQACREAHDRSEAGDRKDEPPAPS